MRFFASTLPILALAGAALASASSPDQQQEQEQEQRSEHTFAARSSGSSSSSSSHNIKRHASIAFNREASSFERRISAKRDAELDTPASPSPVRRQKQNFQASNTAGDYPSENQQMNWMGQAYDDPIGAAQSVLQNNVMVFDNPAFSATQYSVNPAELAHRPPWDTFGLPFITPGVAEAPINEGWVNLPYQEGFDLVNWTIVDNAVMPYYITSGYNAQTVKRAILVWPGKPRDCWKYGAYIMSALYVAQLNASQYGIPTESQPSNATTIIVSPMIMNDQDLAAGAVQPDYISFHGSRWQSGYQVVHPLLNRTLTSYDIMDNFTDWLFDKTKFPNLNSVSVVGHSMGGQAAQRYAMLKKNKVYDDNIRYWIGNPGSWAWLNEDRPYAGLNASCDATYDEWGYGLGGNLSKMTRYGRKQVNTSKDGVIGRFLSRRVHIALALLDNGAGDTHCEAQRQGTTHLSRGSQFVQDVADYTNGVWPEKFTLSYVPNTSHSDFNMFEANQSLWHIFAEDMDTRYEDTGDASSPGDVPKKIPGTKAFATPTHKIMAYSLLLGSIALIAFAFTCLPYLFQANTNSWEEAAWESESKRKLI
ncbi:hypothetical protein V8E36_002030 [Tilletia maclaganii]